MNLKASSHSIKREESPTFKRLVFTSTLTRGLKLFILSQLGINLSSMTTFYSPRGLSIL